MQQRPLIVIARQPQSLGPDQGESVGNRNQDLAACVSSALEMVKSPFLPFDPLGAGKTARSHAPIPGSVLPLLQRLPWALGPWVHAKAAEHNPGPG